jgi:hypothetical protein
VKCSNCECVTHGVQTIGADEVQLICGNCSKTTVLPIPDEVAPRVAELAARIAGYRDESTRLRTSLMVGATESMERRHRLKRLAAADRDEIKELVAP